MGPNDSGDRDLWMHKLVFKEDVLADGTALAYFARGEKLLEGYKKGCGIYCFCCNNEVSPSQFEAHAGRASRRKPKLRRKLEKKLRKLLPKQRKVQCQKHLNSSPMFTEKDMESSAK